MEVSVKKKLLQRDMIKKMVLKCCVLHNICEENGDHFCEDLPDMHVNMLYQSLGNKKELMSELH